jgi:type II secretory pathway component PulF
VTRIVEATAAADARIQLERDGFKVFSVSAASGGIASVLPFGNASRKRKVKQADFLLFNQQLSALLRAGIPVFTVDHRS